MNPGTPVTNIEPLHDGPRTIPVGTLGIIEWCDMARGEAAVQFIGHILQRGVDVRALRECTPWMAPGPLPDRGAPWAEHVSARARAIALSVEEAVEGMRRMGVIDMPDVPDEEGEEDDNGTS